MKHGISITEPKQFIPSMGEFITLLHHYVRKNRII